MDYLTILSTCSLTLFTSPSSHCSPFSSPCPSPTTSDAPSIVTPSSVSIPITSVLYNDTQTAWFLLAHVLAGPSFFGKMDKQTETEAEILVWREIDRAKMCTRAIGSWFGTNERRIEKGELRELAARFGVDISVKGDVEALEDHFSHSRHGHDLLDASSSIATSMA